MDPTRLFGDAPFLVLMKMDSARGIDQGDLTRMLALADDSALERTRAVLARYSHDPAAIDDLEQYLLLGRLELGDQR
ncbi:MAG: hypothetical protein ACREM2_01985 [Vulcanimicrobiaceae bacterium]